MPASPWDEFSGAFDQAAMKNAPAVDPETPLPFSPSQRYVDKNLAPEQSLSYGDVGELGYAAKTAVKTGVLPKEVADHMLPMAMVEGRPGNFGINAEGNGFAVSPRILANAKKLGVGITDMTDPANIERHRFDSMEQDMQSGGYNYYKNITIQGPNGPQTAQVAAEGPPTTPLTIDHPFIKQKDALSAASRAAGFVSVVNRARDMKQKQVLINGSSGRGDMAATMAVILAEKRAVANGDLAATIKGYNGSGPKTEQYWAKVQAAKGLLAHQRNAAILQHYNKSFLGN